MLNNTVAPVSPIIQAQEHHNYDRHPEYHVGQKSNQVGSLISGGYTRKPPRGRGAPTPPKNLLH